jgi:hypothetical protein
MLKSAAVACSCQLMIYRVAFPRTSMLGLGLYDSLKLLVYQFLHRPLNMMCATEPMSTSCCCCCCSPAGGG